MRKHAIESPSPPALYAGGEEWGEEGHIPHQNHKPKAHDYTNRLVLAPSIGTISNPNGSDAPFSG